MNNYDYNSKTWFRHIVHFHKMDTVTRLWKEVLIVGAYTALVAFFEIQVDEKKTFFQDTIMIHTLLGFVISMLLVFRTNTAYDRWWEGRKQWGYLVNNCRNLSMKVSNMVSAGSQRDLLLLIKSYPIAAKNHLRGLDEDLPCEHLIPKRAKHVPNAIANQLYERIIKERRESAEFSDEDFHIIDRDLKELTNIIGACERIKNTPIPYPYFLFIKKFIFVYIATLPIGLVTRFEYFTVPIVMFMFYVFVSFEVLAEEIEEPFGTDTGDLPTDTLAETIGENVEEIFET